MTSVLPSGTASVVGPRLQNRFYTPSGTDLGVWAQLADAADTNPEELLETLGIAFKPTILFPYSLTQNRFGIFGVTAIGMDRPASRMHLRTALQPYGTIKDQKLILAQNGSTDLADNIDLHANLAYHGANRLHLGALQPIGEITTIEAPVGDPKKRTLELALRGQIGLPLSALPYKLCADEFGIPYQVFQKK